MSFHSFYKELEGKAQEAFPSLPQGPKVNWEYLVSPLEIKLPKSVYQQAEKAITAFYQMSRQPKFSQAIQEVPSEILQAPTKHHSVLMAYDFHSTEQGDVFLVEINTNASGYLLCTTMHAAHEGKSVHQLPAVAELKRSFVRELELSGRKTSAVKAAITDEELDQQKMLSEFYMYRDLFQSWGWAAEIIESRDLEPKNFDLIYNRLTDFYFEFPQHQALREAYLKDQVCVTPQPKEYALLADKQRLVDMATPNWLETNGASPEQAADIRRVLIPTFDKSQFESIDEVWNQRKTLFFKPKRAFGGKSVYRGESVSRKVFERLMNEDILIQKFVPAQRMPTDDPRSVLTNWKFDLRFFVFEDKIQQVGARIYQGQVTNFSSPLGGFTKVAF